jgi:hypothetical protein
LTNACFNAGCDNAEAKGGGVTRTMLGGEVVPYLAQSSAQESISSATLGLDSCVSAVSQQTISIMSFMPHSPALKCMGIPAKVLPASTTKRNKDASRAFMCRSTLLKNRIQRSLPRPSDKSSRTWMITIYGAAIFMPELFTRVFTQSRTNLRNFSRLCKESPQLFIGPRRRVLCAPAEIPIERGECSNVTSLTLTSHPSKYLLRLRTIPYAARPQRRQFRLDAGSFPES